MRRALAAAAALLCAGALALAEPARAQELSVLEMDDFIHPETLAEVVAGAERTRFFAARLVAGGATGYQSRGASVEEATGMLHAIGAVYAKRWQGTLNLTAFGAETGGEVPRFRARAQLARYLASSGNDDGLRARLAYTVEEGARAGAEHEIAADLDFNLAVDGLHHGWTGGAVYARNLTLERHYLGLATRLPVVRWKNGSALRLGAGVANDRARLEELSALPNLRKGEVSLEWVLPLSDARLHVAYTPSDHDQLGRNHELSLLLSAGLFSALF